MRWPTCFILAYVMLGLQVGVSPYVLIHGAAPNLGLIAVLFIAMNMKRDAALIASFAVGLAEDLLTSQQPGLYAFSFGLVAMLVVSAHRLINRDHPLTHIVLALLGGLVTALVVLAHSWIHPAGPTVGEGKNLLGPMRISAGVECARLLYTAALAPFVLVVLQRIRKGLRGGMGRRRDGEMGR
jgi:rod shape-determining protein MreD